MKRNVRHPFVLATWLVLVVVVLGSGLHPKQADAAVSLVTLAEKNQDWSFGRFFRTGLSSANGVQLIPAKVHKQYDPATSQLPIALSDHASVTYRERIFVVGGYTSTDGLMHKSAQVFASRLLDPSTGALSSWQTLPPLPEDYPANNTEGLIPPPRVAVSNAAAVVVEVGGQPYLFVLGGYRGRDRANNYGLDTVTTSRIFYLPIRFDAQNNVRTDQLWHEIAAEGRLPFQPNDLNYDNVVPPINGSGGAGARDLGVASVVVNNEPWIYTFGGNSRILVEGSSYERYSSRVNRAKVTLAQGGVPDQLALEWRDDFNNNAFKIKGTGVPEAFLADAATVKSVDPTTGNIGVYLIGGKICSINCLGENNTQAPTYEDDANAYVARINGTTGAIEWLPSGNMSEGRYGHAAFENEGQINISGGQVHTNASSADALPTVAEGYVNYPELDLYKEDSAANFIHESGALADGRLAHTMETLDGGKYGDWAYVIGGRVGAALNQVPVTSDVLLGNIDTPPLMFDKYVASGNYYSQVFKYGSNTTKSTFYSFQWTAVDEGGSPIEMFYRYSLDDGSMTAYLPMSALQPIVDYQGRPGYKHTFPTPISSSRFQFMAKLNRPALQVSPTLLLAQLTVEVPGFPNIKVSPGGATMVPSEITLTGSIAPYIHLTNTAYQISPTQTVPPLPANWDGGGSFFVLLYLQRPNEPQPAFSAPVIGNVEPVAYAMVDKASLPVMQPGEQFEVPPSTWYRYDATGLPANTEFWRGLFDTVGQYTLYVVLDGIDDPDYPLGMVSEAPTPGVDGESDNVSSFTFTVAQALNRSYLPLISANAGGTTTSAHVPAQPRGLPKLSK